MEREWGRMMPSGRGSVEECLLVTLAGESNPDATLIELKVFAIDVGI
jgi:hypothetical protein